MRDLITEADFESLTAVWRRAIGVAAKFVELRHTDETRTWPRQPWSWT
jgi:hypothetical protein